MPGRRPPPPPPGSNAPPPLPSRPGPAKPVRSEPQPPVLPYRPPNPPPPEEDLDVDYVLPAEDTYEEMRPGVTSYTEKKKEERKRSAGTGKVTEREDEEDDDQDRTYDLPAQKENLPNSSRDLPEDKDLESDDGWSDDFSDTEPMVSNSPPALPPARHLKQDGPTDGITKANVTGTQGKKGSREEPAKKTSYTGGGSNVQPRPTPPLGTASNGTFIIDHLKAYFETKDSEKQLIEAGIKKIEQSKSAGRPTPPPKPKDSSSTLTPGGKKSTPPHQPIRKVTPSPQDKIPNFIGKMPLPERPGARKHGSGSEDNASAGSTSSDSGGHVPTHGTRGQAHVVKPEAPNSRSPQQNVRHLPGKVRVLPDLISSCTPQHAEPIQPAVPNHRNIPLPAVPGQKAGEIKDHKHPPLPPVPIEEDIYDEGASTPILPWFHGNINRSQGKERLENFAAKHTEENGIFLIRDSTQSKYCLMVWVDGKEYNLMIRERPEDLLLAIGKKKADEVTFNSLQELVDHHKSNCLTVFDAKTDRHISVKLLHFPPKP